MSDLPTKPGAYYWREKAGDDWELWHVLDNGSELTAHQGFNVAFPSDLGGQWLPIPIPDAEELVELQRKAKAYDEATEVWGIFKGGELTASGENRNTAIASAQRSAGYRNPHFDMRQMMWGTAGALFLWMLLALVALLEK